MDHIYEEVSSLHSKLGDMESSIIQQVSAEIKSYVPTLLLKDSIRSSVSKSIIEELPHVEAQVQKNLQDQLPNLLLKPMYKEFNAFNKLESQQFVILQKELSKSLHKNMKKSIRLKVRKEMKEVRDKLTYCTDTVSTNSQHFQDLRVMFHDMEKNNPGEERDAQHPDQTKGEQISGTNIADIVQGEKASAQVIPNEEKAMVIHNPEEKKPEGNVSMKDDSDDDALDNQTLSKRFFLEVLTIFSIMMVQATEDMGVDSANPTDSHSIPIITQPSSSKPQNKKSRRKQRQDNAPTEPNF
ncbi:hypothetical protein Tco_1133568 [Tanacetum coccineum]